METTVASAEPEGELDFAGFFHAEYEQLLRKMYVLCRNRAEAEDLSQEAMARAAWRLTSGSAVWDWQRRTFSGSHFILNC